MKTPRLFALSLLGLPVLALAAPVDSHISAATVYSDRAVVTRTAELDLSPGETALVFERMPTNLVDQSLQVSAHGTATATILDVNAETTFVDATPNPRVKELEDQILELNRQGRALDDRTGVLKEEREFVRRMMLSATGAHPGASETTHGAEASTRPSLEELQKLYGYSDETLGKIAAEMGALDDKRADLAGRKAVLSQQLDPLRNVQGKSVKNVTVRVAASTAGHLEVTLRYAVPGASWAPSYDARLHSDERSVDLGYFGMVRNATGEDWSNIELTLSTARPGLGGSAPELRPWVVDVRQPEGRDYGTYSKRAESAPAAARARTDLKDVAGEVSVVTSQFLQDPANAPVDQLTYNATAEVQSNATSATFRIAGSVSILANNSVQRVSIASSKLTAVLQYDATPKLAEIAYLSAEAANTTDYPLLAGSMNTFLDDTFVATSRLKTVMPGEKFELHLGADEGIAIKRKLVTRFAENTGLTNNGARVTYEYLITVTNNKRQPERVVFKEPLPVSRQEKIVVKLIAPEEESVGTKTDPKEVNREEDGRLVWRLDLKPGEKREVPLKFSISYPADVQVAGLE